MKTEMEKCLAGEWYDCHDPSFMNLKSKAHHLLMKYNSLPYEQKTEKHAILKEMFGSIGANVSVGHSFICDYGCNIHIGDNVTVNTGCTFVDCNRITIGNNVLVAPNVQIYTATHPVEFNERLVLTETSDGCKYVRRTFALPVMIEDGCWIGGGVIILPGVTIGQKCVIGAGSVVVSDVPPNSTVVGVPGKVVKQDGERVNRIQSIVLDQIDLPNPVDMDIEKLARENAELRQALETFIIHYQNSEAIRREKEK